MTPGKLGRTVTRRQRVEVAFHHVDMLGVVHNVQYLKWFELGRLQLIDEMVSIEAALRDQLAIPVVLNHCEYLRPARYRDQLVVTTTHRLIERWEGRLAFDHAISNAKTKEVLCTGTSAVTLLDLETQRVLKEIPVSMWSRYLALR